MIQKTISLCIIGKPNAGKSSLLNKIIGEKLSIVTPKVQTTRSIITGIVTIEDCQLILIDTPGIFEPSKNLERAMVRCAWSSLNNVDLVMVIIDSTKKLDDMIITILSRLQELKIKPIILLNKTDLKKTLSSDLEKSMKEYCENLMIFKISALLGDNVDSLVKYICSLAKQSPWLYAEDDITNLPMKFLASEITREQLFLNLHEELPYNLTVETEIWQENKDKSIKIHQVIVVARESHKIIILGKKGALIKEIGINARLEMEKFFGIKFHLFLFVKVRPLWEERSEFYEYMGLKLIK